MMFQENFAMELLREAIQHLYEDGYTTKEIAHIFMRILKDENEQYE